MKKENINKDILRLAAPAVLNNITVPLLGLCDTAIAGHLGSPSFLAAIAIGSMMLNVFYWLAGFLRMGTTGLTAQGYGRESSVQCREILRKSLLLAWGIAAIVLCAQIPLLKLFLLIVSPEADVAELAALYFKIGIWGVPAQLTIMAVSGWFIGLQSTVVPMTIAISTNVVNILTSLLLAFGLNKGFQGIIYGTLIANWVGALFALLWARKRWRMMTPPIKDKLPPEEWSGGVKWKDLFSVNSALFIRSGCIMAVTMTVTSVGARLGETTLAANAIIMQFFLFFSYFMDGFAFSGEALVGKFEGAGNIEGIKVTLLRLLGWGAIMAVTFYLIYQLFHSGIIALLTDSESVRHETERYLMWILLLPPVTVSAFIFDGIFVGLTRTGDMMKVTIAGAAIFFLLLFLTGLPLTNTLLWGSFEAYLFIRGVALAIIFFREYPLFKRKKLSL